MGIQHKQVSGSSKNQFSRTAIKTSLAFLALASTAGLCSEIGGGDHMSWHDHRSDLFSIRGIRPGEYVAAIDVLCLSESEKSHYGSGCT
jgi:hypothetical protein